MPFPAPVTLLLALACARSPVASPEAPLRPAPVAHAAPIANAAPRDEDAAEAAEEAAEDRADEEAAQKGPMVPAPPHEPIPADIGVVFFGDAGTGHWRQRRVADRIGEFCATARCDAVALLGDNFYPSGVTSTTDPQWQSKFVDVYGRLGLPFHAALGNHDYLGDPGAEVGWQVPPGTPSTWDMPSRTYTWTLGPITFIVLDTSRPTEDQKAWYKRQLGAARTQWTVTYGHHPLWSGGQHGDTTDLESWSDLIESGDLYLCGHDHDQEVIHRPGLVEVVMGTGGAGLRPIAAAPGAKLAREGFGFGYLSVKGDRLYVTVVDDDGAVVATSSWTQAQIEAADQPGGPDVSPPVPAGAGGVAPHPAKR